MSKTITGIVTWLKQWFYDKDEIDTKFNDTGWQLVTMNSGYDYYSTTSKLYVRRIGKMVEIKGIWKPTSQQTATLDPVTFATIPSQYRPSTEIRAAICQGHGIKKWMLRVNSSGNLQWSRYGNTTSINLPSGAWMVTHITYMVN